MRDYSKISDEELTKRCFVSADKKYITNLIKDSKKFLFNFIIYWNFNQRAGWPA